MKIVKADAALFDPEQLGLTPYQFIERIGRICYKSEDKITDESSIKFVNALSKNQHTAMFEHANLYITMSIVDYIVIKAILDIEAEQVLTDAMPPIPLKTFFRMTDYGNTHVISANFRAWSQLLEWYSNLSYESLQKILTSSYFTNLRIQASYMGKILHTLKPILRVKMKLHAKYPEIFRYDCSPDEIEIINSNTSSDRIKIFDSNTAFIDYIWDSSTAPEDVVNAILKQHVVHTVIFTCDRGISHELVRHRPASYAQESTRFCNYGINKFGKEITVIEPCYWTNKTDAAYQNWYDSCLFSEEKYFALLDSGCTAQQARGVLPTDLKTEIAVTATENEWEHILNLRLLGTTGKPHPKMIEVMNIAYPQLHKISNNRLTIRAYY